ncbi:hypothetical protein CERSUDRAFT_35899, partial [Gelatoporia subvermispora B]
LFTHTTDPWKPERICSILRAVTIGTNLTTEQTATVRALLTEYADCFALSVSEVLPVKGAVHLLNIPDGATFSRKVHQCPLTPPQKEFLHKKIDELLVAGIIAHCDPSQVKCVSP